jgi:hypothetical protein
MLALGRPDGLTKKMNRSFNAVQRGSLFINTFFPGNRLVADGAWEISGRDSPISRRASAGANVGRTLFVRGGRIADLVTGLGRIWLDGKPGPQSGDSVFLPHREVVKALSLIRPRLRRADWPDPVYMIYI